MRRCWRARRARCARAVAAADGGAGCGAAPAGGRLAGAAVPRAGKRAHVRLDPLGGRLGGGGIRVRAGTARTRRSRCVAGCARAAGVLFLPYGAAQIAALRSIIATWMRLAIFEAMTRPGHDQRLWFIVDELDSLGAIDGLKDALARLRKFGGRCVLGFQSIAQVSATYGAAEAQTIVENCGNTLILRCSGSEHGGHFAVRLAPHRRAGSHPAPHGARARPQGSLQPRRAPFRERERAARHRERRARRRARAAARSVPAT